VKVEERKIDGFNTKLVSYDEIIVGIAQDIGPRILYLASSKRPDFNLLGVLPKAGVETPEGFWKLYGGHRLWSSPEAKPRSYSMDNEPVKVEVKEEKVIIYGNAENQNSLQKEIEIAPFSKNSIKVIHKIKNIGRWSLKLACWALSVMRENGFAIIPIKAEAVDKDSLLPDRHLSWWPYTNLSDKRLLFENEYIFVKQDPAAESPVKIGAMANPNWTAYWVEGMLFLKKFEKQEGEFPDYGCNVEVYTNSDMLELETLSPLLMVNPSECIVHEEIWEVREIGPLSPVSESMAKL